MQEASTRRAFPSVFCLLFVCVFCRVSPLEHHTTRSLNCLDREDHLASTSLSAVYCRVMSQHRVRANHPGNDLRPALFLSWVVWGFPHFRWYRKRFTLTASSPQDVVVPSSLHTSSLP
ncbi:hypothetical protein C8Q70DRAFT_942524 [Cubamyces menziesii]|nr:hypothetical protein C8Q70DRAFT_942524 [Cubamyces menziesii]